ncbi:MAG: orotidine-5'-phosphate decarboxylase [Phycisphaerae bacterium]|nr:orotidine-5'-phosphate decarboxylase [Phycisphaerae bacterium]
MPDNFADRLLKAIRSKRAPACVGIDPIYSRLPAEISEHRDMNDENDAEVALDAVLEFSRRVIRIVAPYVPAVKINIAFFERYYWEGIEGYYELVQEAADRDLIVIGDCKRADIGSTSEMYARAHLADPDFGNLDDLVAPDAVTVNPYFGLDGVRPFIDVARDEGKGVFALVRTTNESAARIQDLPGADGMSFCESVAREVAAWAQDDGLVGTAGYSCVGAVVGAQDRDNALKLRAMMPNSIFLVPGYGAQGGTAEDVAACFKSDGTGAIVNASRSILYAYEDVRYLELYASEWEKCIEQACKDFVADLAKVIRVA